MGRKNILKLVIAIALLIIGTLGSFFVSAYFHLLLTDNIKIISIVEAFTIIKLNKEARKLFLLFELLAISLSLFYYYMKDNFYESELIEITPDIKIPKPAGQMQFGSAWFATDEEKRRNFTICEINSKDKQMREVYKNVKGGEENIKLKYSILQRRWNSNRDRPRRKRKK